MYSKKCIDHFNSFMGHFIPPVGRMTVNGNGGGDDNNKTTYTDDQA